MALKESKLTSMALKESKAYLHDLTVHASISFKRCQRPEGPCQRGPINCFFDIVIRIIAPTAIAFCPLELETAAFQAERLIGGLLFQDVSDLMVWHATLWWNFSYFALKTKIRILNRTRFSEGFHSVVPFPWSPSVPIGSASPSQLSSHGIPRLRDKFLSWFDRVCWVQMNAEGLKLGKGGDRMTEGILHVGAGQSGSFSIRLWCLHIVNDAEIQDKAEIRLWLWVLREGLKLSHSCADGLPVWKRCLLIFLEVCWHLAHGNFGRSITGLLLCEVWTRWGSALHLLDQCAWLLEENDLRKELDVSRLQIAEDFRCVCMWMVHGLNGSCGRCSAMGTIREIFSAEVQDLIHWLLYREGEAMGSPLWGLATSYITGGAISPEYLSNVSGVKKQVLHSTF